METYQIVLITVATSVMTIVFLLAVIGLGFFIGIFKRKKYSELGEHRHESEQRLYIKKLRKEAIDKLADKPCEKLEISAFDGIKLRGNLFYASSFCNAVNDNTLPRSETLAAADIEHHERSQRLIICVHGFTSHSRREYAYYVPYLIDMGFDVLLVDDRAHGASDGKYCGFSVLDRFDVGKWIEAFRTKYDNIWLMGISMGAATVAMAAADYPDDIKGTVFDCGFTSPKDTFSATIRSKLPIADANAIPWLGNLWCRAIAGFDFMKTSALEEIKNTKCPFLFIHGDRDPVVPIEMSKQMYDACPSDKKQRHVFKDCEHVASAYMYPDEYFALLKEFFEV